MIRLVFRSVHFGLGFAEEFFVNKTPSAPRPAPSSKFKRFIIASLLLHIIITLCVMFTPDRFLKEEKPLVVQMELIERTPEPPPPPKPIPVDEKQQVVDQDEKAPNDEVVPDTKFLSANNQTVKKQTVAANQGEFKNLKSKSKTADSGSKNKFKPLSPKDFHPSFDVSKLIEDRMKVEKERELKAEEDAVKILEQRKKAVADEQKKQAEKTKQASSSPTGDDSKGKSGAQASQTIDYIKDLDQGMETMLSTKEFVYYTYYARIRRQLNQYWGPKVREKMTNLYKQGRTIASAEDRVTKLLITLDQKGVLVRVQVIGNSGVRDLDEAAVEAFRAAAPFPNPPNGMIDPDGQIKLRWDFILEA